MKRCLLTALGTLLLAPTVSALIDTNSNGLSDLWERAFSADHQLFPPTFNPQADADDDGWTNEQEAAAGTDPFDPNPPDGLVRPETAHIPAVYEPDEYGMPKLKTPEAVTVTWPTLVGKQYTLLFSPDLSEGSWFPVGAPYIGNGNDFVYSFEDFEIDSRFWRIAVADVDTDGDDLFDWEEHELGTSPTDPDSDHDGVWDGIDGTPTVNNVQTSPDTAAFIDPATGLPTSFYTGLRAYWSFELTQAGGTQYPNVANSSWPVIISAVAADAAGIIATAAAFPTTNASSLKAPPEVITGTIPYTISFWVKCLPNSIQGKSGTLHTTLFAFNGNLDSNPELYLTAYKATTGSGQLLTVYRKDYNGASPQLVCYLTSGNYLDDGKWHHLALTRAPNGTTRALALYHNGAQLAAQMGTGSTTDGSYTAAADGYFTLGAYGPGVVVDTGIHGSLDRFAIHSRTLSAEEITGLYNLDSEFDSLPDRVEITNPQWRDINSDGTGNSGEMFYQLSPFIWNDPIDDTDQDGIPTLTELADGTDPGDPDTDGDLIPDGWEKDNGLNPKIPNDATGTPLTSVTDRDGDGLSNLEEYRYGTNPNNPNTDGDALGDKQEVNGPDNNPATDDGSDPTDSTDNGVRRPADQLVTFNLGVGDRSGSHSEDYVLNVFRIDPATGAEQRKYTLRSGGFGQYATTTRAFKKGETHVFQIEWLGTNNHVTTTGSGSSTTIEGPDWDYHLVVEPQGTDTGGILIDSYNPATGTIDSTDPLCDPQDIANSDDDDDNIADFPYTHQSKRVVFLPFDADVDSDNTNQAALPDRILAEESLETVSPPAVPSAAAPGKILMVNDGDVDSDMVPDFADGLDRFASDGIRLPSQSTDRAESAPLVPLVLQLPTGTGVWAAMKVRFQYDGSDPALISRGGSPGAYTYTPAPGALRLWKRDHNGRLLPGDTVSDPVRKVAAIHLGGDWIKPGYGYSPAQIGFVGTSGQSVFYVEALAASVAVRDQTIGVEVDPDGAGPLGYTRIATLDFTAINMTLVKVDANNQTTPVRAIETSTPAPELKLSRVKVLEALPNVDGTAILGKLALTGTIRSMVCDFTKPEDGGSISQVRVFVNGAEDPAASITATVSKTTDTSSLLRPYPYSATFTQTLEDLPLIEGANTIRVEAADPLDGAVGYEEYTVLVSGVSAFANGGGGGTVTDSLSLTLTGPLAPATADTLTATLLTAAGTTGAVTLVETGPDTAIFRDIAETFEITITSPAEAFAAGEPDYLAASVIHTTLVPDGAVFTHLTETAAASLVFSQQNLLDDDAWQSTDYLGYTFSPGPAALTSANSPGSMTPYMLRLTGPDALLAYIDTIDTADGPRKVEKSAVDGQYYVKMKNSPPAVYLWKVWEIGNNDALNNEEKMLALLDLMAEGLSDELQYRIGLVHGMYDGGASMVEGIWGLLKFIVEATYKWTPAAVSIRWLNGDEFKAEKQFFSTSWETVKQLGGILWMLESDQLNLYSALIMGDDPALNTQLEAMGDKYGDAFVAAAEVLEALAEHLANLTPRERGYYEGRASFEILGLFFAWEAKVPALLGNAAKLTKANFLRALSEVKFFKLGKGKAAFEKLFAEADFLTRLANTKMCFVAGTPVLTTHGTLPIERVAPGMIVLSRDPATGQQGYKPVVATFVTHPETLWQLRFATLGGAAAETLVCTGEHPFWVRETGGFLPAAKMSPGQTVLLSGGGTLLLLSKTSGHAPPGESFTTYNFEVADWHTYFAGSRGVWVHNQGAACQHIFSAFDRLKRRFGKTAEQAWETIETTYVKAGGKRVGKYSDTDLGDALEDVLLNHVYNDPNLQLWTKGPKSTPGENMFGHYKDHVLDNKSGIPGGEFPGITNAVDYVKAARLHVNPTGPVNVPGSSIVSWAQSGGKTAFLDIATKRFGVRIDATGEIATFFVSNEKNKSGAVVGLLQWAKNHQYPHPAFP